MPLFIGIDGGGTRTTAVIGDAGGRELARTTGAAGLVDPRWPLAAVETIIRLVRELLLQVGSPPPVEALCAGLAGTGVPESREAVRHALRASGVARRIVLCSDGEIALEGALPDRAGILLVSGTGSIAWGRGVDGRVQRCGGWGSILGDEGSGYALGRAGLMAALRAHDGRGPSTALLPAMLSSLGLEDPERLRGWAGRAEKGEIAARAVDVIRLAEEGEPVAVELVREGATALAEHARALLERLGPWRDPVPVVLHGGLGDQPIFAAAVEAALTGSRVPVRFQSPASDPVAGALRIARTSAS